MEVEKKNEKSSVIAIVILTILVIALGGYIGYDKFLSEDITSTTEENSKNETNAKNEIENTVEENTNENKTDDSRKYCEGTYYGEASGSSSNGLTYNYKYTYILNKNGTYTASFGDVSGTSGVYVINDNTVSFIGKKSVVGPREDDPYYTTSDYVIADDCSYIKINDGNISFNLNKQ